MTFLASASLCGQSVRTTVSRGYGAGIALVNSMVPPDKKAEAFSRLAITWGTKDPKAAADWVEQLNDPSAMLGAAETIASFWAQKDPAAAAPQSGVVGTARP
jgi:hypothetical protein